jgi:periplasmic divalent cation tolerance protein
MSTYVAPQSSVSAMMRVVEQEMFVPCAGTDQAMRIEVAMTHGQWLADNAQHTAAPPYWAWASRQLVEERWCACGQQINPIRSIYRWQGAIHDDPEIRVALHTQTTLDHPYDVPCILAFPVDDANPDYVAWVETETREAA